MAFISRLVMLVAVATSAIPFVTATQSCPSNHFSYNALGKNLCISIGGSNPYQGSAPSGKSCPGDYFWHTGASCCVPSTPSYPQTPSCSGSSLWDKTEQCCKPSTPTTSKLTTPTTSKPSKPSTTSTPSKPTSTPDSCQNGYFQWQGLKNKCCIPHGGQPKPPSPPSGSSCPSSWYWHSDQGCCVPEHPSPPTPSCPANSWWGNQCCNHNPAPPKPSGHYNYAKRTQKKRSNASLCPTGLEACPVGSLTSLATDFECIDTVHEVQSCGGCSSVHPALDCTAIEGSWNVGCDRGVCKVYSCQAGYKLARDGASCEKLL